MSNSYTSFAIDVPFVSKKGVTYAKAKLDAGFLKRDALNRDPDGDGDDAGFTFYADWSNITRQLVIWHDEYGRVDHAADFIKSMMIAGHVLEPLVLVWSNHSDRVTEGSQGGGAVLVTKDGLYWFEPRDLADKKWRDIEKRRKRLR